MTDTLVEYGNILVPSHLNFGQSLAFIRKSKNLSRTELARLCAIAQGKDQLLKKNINSAWTTIYNWENNLRIPKFESQVILCNILKITPSELGSLLHRVNRATLSFKPKSNVEIQNTERPVSEVSDKERKAIDTTGTIPGVYPFADKEEPSKPDLTDVEGWWFD